MGRSIWAFIRRVSSSGLSQLLLIFSTCLLLLVWQTIDEPFLVKCDLAKELGIIPMTDCRMLPNYFLVNLPSLFLTIGVTKLFRAVFAMSCASAAKFETVVLVVCCSIQWMLIGYGVKKYFRWRRARSDSRE